ncbi:hypothetical protein [Leifsonia sp. Root112D2]|uniref:hypothetical protein n=1 Tax=Leifsonia sp. Root112D2 TaxID=1736426 RepID=UPI0006FF3EC4|nr:hypothetical protein [Leifsonia sp. Root112D2]KQV05137.1 hypothetical protein ASC63_15190 [Leifsonia sp. Root112D2]
MPRSIEEILAHGDELAKRFETYEPSPQDEVNLSAFLALRTAVAQRAESERRLASAIADARRAKLSWARIGTVMGTSGEAVRQRYGAIQRPR